MPVISQRRPVTMEMLNSTRSLAQSSMPSPVTCLECESLNDRMTLKGLSGHFRKDHLRTVASHSSLISVDSFTSLLSRIIGNGGSQHTFFFNKKKSIQIYCFTCIWESSKRK